MSLQRGWIAVCDGCFQTETFQARHLARVRERSREVIYLLKQRGWAASTKTMKTTCPECAAKGH